MTDKAPENTFSKLAGLDVSDHVEKKGKFSYLSWPWAVAELRKADPEARWEVVRFDGLPYLKSECGYFVEVAVTVNGITLSQIHPVLDNNNKPIAQPNSYQINTSIQRCLVKAIALHGLGLYIYAGEDLPEGAEPSEGGQPEGKNQTRGNAKQNTPSLPPSGPPPASSSIPSPLKAKYQLVKGDLDGLEEWVEKQRAKGRSYADMEHILQKMFDQPTEQAAG